jgi:hypothetical protein
MAKAEDVRRYADTIMAMIKEDQDTGQVPRSVCSWDELDETVDAADYYRLACLPSGTQEAAELRNAVDAEVGRRLADRGPGLEARLQPQPPALGPPDNAPGRYQRALQAGEATCMGQGPSSWPPPCREHRVHDLRGRIRAAGTASVATDSRWSPRVVRMLHQRGQPFRGWPAGTAGTFGPRFPGVRSLAATAATRRGFGHGR